MVLSEVRELRQQAQRLPVEDVVSYTELRDNVIIGHFPHATNRCKDDERREYLEVQEHRNDFLESTLYRAIWHDLLPNERIALEHLNYEDPALVDDHTRLHTVLHDYVTAKRKGNKEGAKKHLSHAVWEVLNALPDKSTITSRLPELYYSNCKQRRKAQAMMLNTLAISTYKLPTPDYVVSELRAAYAATPLEALLPNINFPLEEAARSIANEIQHINLAIQQLLMHQKKSIVSESTNIPEATDAFVELANKIMEDVRTKINEEIDKQAAEGKTEAEIRKHIAEVIEHYQDVTIPHKMEMLATHFNGKLSEVNQQEQGYTYYRWHSQDDEKVRPEHAVNDGKIFLWEFPPPTGNPGEDYNCRCWAEPVRLEDLTAEDFQDGPVTEIPIEDYLLIGGAIKKGLKEAWKKIFRDPVKQRPKGVPKDWVKKPSKKGTGTVYEKPGSKGTTYVKVQKGNPNNTQPGQQVDNVRWVKDGKSLDKNGNQVLINSQESHIPLDEFEFNKELFKWLDFQFIKTT